MTGTGTGRIAFRTFKWMLGFSAVAAGLAWLLSVLIQPGAGMVFDQPLDSALEESAQEALGWQDTLLNFVSTNIFDAMATATMVPIIVFSLLLGIALRTQINTTGRHPKTVTAEELNLDEYHDAMARADAAD